MKCSDVPTFAKFEKWVRQHSEDPILADGFHQVSEILASAPRPLTSREMATDPAQMFKLKESCQAVEKATRVMWACAAATNNITPPMWEEVPDFGSALEYFNQLGDLDLMAATEEYRLIWDNSRAGSVTAQRPGW
jgi:hypothetical protein